MGLFLLQVASSEIQASEIKNHDARLLKEVCLDIVRRLRRTEYNSA